jgi:hypothetical protein
MTAGIENITDATTFVHLVDVGQTPCIARSIVK